MSTPPRMSLEQINCMLQECWVNAAPPNLLSMLRENHHDTPETFTFGTDPAAPQGDCQVTTIWETVFVPLVFAEDEREDPPLDEVNPALPIYNPE